MKTLFKGVVILCLLTFATTASATQVKLHVGTLGDDDGWTGLFNQMQFFANTTTTQFGDPNLGALPQVGDTFSDFGNLNVTSFTGLVGDDEGLGVDGSTGTAYSLTATWDDLAGYVETSTPIPSSNPYYLQSTIYTAGTFNFYLDADVDQDFGSTVFADDDSNFGLDANAVLVGTLELVSGTGENTFNLDGSFRQGSSKIYSKFTFMKDDFWFDALGLDIATEYFLQLGWDVNAEVDQNTDNVVVQGIYDDGVLFRVGSDHDGSVELNVVPEPSTIILLGAGLLGLGYISRRKKRS